MNIPELPGLLLVQDVITPELERAVLAFAEGPSLSWEHPLLRKGLLPARRGMISYGFRYVTQGRSLSGAESLPSVIEACRAQAAAGAQLDPARLEQAILTRYPRKAGIGWHTDAPVFGEPVITLSLGCDWWAEFRRVPEGPVLRVPLPARSILVLRGEARWCWQHRIPELKSLRYSVSFRTLADRTAGPLAQRAP